MDFGGWPVATITAEARLAAAPPKALIVRREQHGLILISQARSPFPGNLFHKTDLIFTSHGAGELL